MASDEIESRTYYNVSSITANAVAADPNDYTSNQYDVHNIANEIGKIARCVYVANDAVAGGATIYVMHSHVGRMNGSHEIPIYAQQFMRFEDVYELKVRSPTKGTPYRVTMYKVGSLQ